jgi:hypothetical protein
LAASEVSVRFVSARGGWRVALIVAALAAGCRGATPPPGESGKMEAMKPVADVIAAHAPELMKIEGVAGVYEGETAQRRPCVRIMLVKRTPELESKLPRTLDGYPVEIEETGEIKPMGR